MNHKHTYFVTAIDTEVGKTVVSALLVKALNAKYWKPIQSGLIPTTDSKELVDVFGIHKENILPEAYRLETPASPHLAAAIDGVEIDMESMQIPVVESPLIVEGAGGLLVPFNEHQTWLDWLKMVKIPVIIVTKNYLGSINHTLLTVKMLQEHQIEIKGIVFNGESNESTEQIIIKHTGIKRLFDVPKITNFSTEKLEELTQEIAHKMND